MATGFLHGVSVAEAEEGGGVVQTVATSVIGLVGTTEHEAIDGNAIDGTMFVCTKGNNPIKKAGIKKAEVPTDPPTPPPARGRRNTPTVNPGNDKFIDNSALFSLDAIFEQTNAIVVCLMVKSKDKVNDAIKKLVEAESETGYHPRIILAPGFSDDGTLTTLASVADSLKAIAIFDAPETLVGENGAITVPTASPSDRVRVCYPPVLVPSGDSVREEPLSPREAGVIARSDNERGWWWSPSNLEINGIVKTKKPIPFAMGDANCLANQLNEKGITTCIRQNGWRLWGNHTLADRSHKYSFVCVRRTADVLSDSLLRSHLWAVDRNITKTYVADVLESVNAYLRDLRAMGAILGGKCWVDPEKNSTSQIKQGKVTFDFDFTPNYPAENVTFTSHMVDEYIKEIFK